MRVTLMIPSLQAGGAERVISIMANYWAAKKWDVSIVTLTSLQQPPFYPLHESIQHYPLNVTAASRNALEATKRNTARILAMRMALRHIKPDVVIAFLTPMNVLTILATRGLHMPVIVSDRVAQPQRRLGQSWVLLQRWLYPYANQVVLQTNDALDFFPGSVRQRACVIPNPVVLSQSTLHKLPGTDQPKTRTVMALGRLVEQKGFDMLLRAFALVREQHQQWSLIVWGEGEQRAALQSLTSRLGLDHYVRFPGITRQPFVEMQQADLFVLSSRFEGFPNALCEAMAYGLPVISFDCPSGPRDIIRDGIDGLLVPTGDVAALARAMDRLMTDEPERIRLRSNAPKILERFGVESVMGRWEVLLEEVCHTNILQNGSYAH